MKGNPGIAFSVNQPENDTKNWKYWEKIKETSINEEKRWVLEWRSFRAYEKVGKAKGKIGQGR